MRNSRTYPLLTRVPTPTMTETINTTGNSSFPMLRKWSTTSGSLIAGLLNHEDDGPGTTLAAPGWRVG
ncbi:hypothetical protein [Reticulibacter mediterranei]|uniref:hypothetical protein n=1 Tax=Reticulibacter mediterranei TaxID=2778369 RepID=UPI001C68769A|nr:hypothetical protein [Reticulibacter mediterranei]